MSNIFPSKWGGGGVGVMVFVGDDIIIFFIYFLNCFTIIESIKITSIGKC